MTEDLAEALRAAPWNAECRYPTAMELERWLSRQRPSVRVEYLARLLTTCTDAEEPRASRG